MALIPHAGSSLTCPCCGLSLPYVFRRVTLAAMNPPLQSGNLATATERDTRNIHECLQCGFVLELGADHPNNAGPARVAERLQQRRPKSAEPLPAAVPSGEAPRAPDQKAPEGKPALEGKTAK